VTTQFALPDERPLAPEKEGSDRSILIGIVGTLLFHLLLVVLSPRFAFDEFSGIHSGIRMSNKDRGKTFDFELADSAQEKPRNPFQFVETNPDAPENTPDRTDNFSNRNQQSAQLEAPKEIDAQNRPSITDAQDKIQNETAIVTGDMSQPQLGAAARPESKDTAEQEQNEQKVRVQLVPLEGFEKSEGPSEEGIATNIAKNQQATTHADRSQDGAREGQELEGGLLATNAAHQTQPKARPRLTAPRPTILSNRATGTSNIGILGMDARWSEYGDYINELIEIVQTQWYRILRDSAVSPPRGSHVIVTFKINTQGETDIVKVEDAEAGKQGVFSCQNAIQARQPYRKWSDAMIAVLGEEQTLTFAFYYQ